ncbi:MAG: ribose 5-phosphate isomerase B [Ruminococcaceae bacterium]|jgi:ribose 5-phosphate isomerase B|nr:ribose 5-phosphate isomerase B [Oscillospiraceae bacterium]
MKIAIGSDHAGYPLKQAVKEHLVRQGLECVDYGTQNAVDSVSYVGYAASVAEAVQKKAVDLGIVVCGTGLGVSMTVNKYRGIRGALCCNEYMARMARQHNDANVLALGARVLGSALALAIVDAFLAEPFESGGRHQVRINEIATVEDTCFKA